MHFLDTNVLIYAISESPNERAKAERARLLLEDDDGALSTQVVQEFYYQATRPRPAALPSEQAIAYLETWFRFPVLNVSLALVREAWAIHQETKFAYWDCAILAAAVALGCSTVYTEDMQAGRVVHGVRITNPFTD